MRRCERTKTLAFEEEQTEGRVGGEEERERAEVCNQAEPVSFSFISHHCGN